MKKLTILSSALIIAGTWQMAQAQPPGGGGGRGGFGNMSFDAINMADEEGNKDDHLTLAELRAFMEEALAGRGGGGRAGGGGDQDFVATMFSSWDTQPEGAPDGMITEEEFNNRPQGGGRRGGGGGRAGGGPPPQ